jgi:hypothetical protein
MPRINPNNKVPSSCCSQGSACCTPGSSCCPSDQSVFSGSQPSFNPPNNQFDIRQLFAFLANFRKSQ